MATNEHPMNGAQALLKTFCDSGVEVCFGNPGTSEMHFVSALDSEPRMRGVLCLFEGVVAGAADGYGRMADKPAATLLHLGPGFANAMANLHNAKRAHTPIVNVIGDHATYHKQFDAPLESDVEGHAALVSAWQRVSDSPDAVSRDAAEAVAFARSGSGHMSSLILPANHSWGEAQGSAAPIAPTPAAAVPAKRVDEVAKLLRSGEPCALLLGGSVLRVDGLTAGSKAAVATGARFLCETFPARLERGAGVPVVDRLAYLPEMMAPQVAGLKHLIVVGTKAPVSFFAYPGKPSSLVPEGCAVFELASPEEDGTAALQNLVEALGAGGAEPVLASATRPEPGSGVLDAGTVASAVGAYMPENAIMADEGQTAGFVVPFTTAGAPPHSWLTLTGGSIGIGMPLATGAAVACPDRKVINLQADGSAMYTLQSLWTQARENLDVTTIVLSNRAYGILNLELERVGALERGPKALSMLDLSNPVMDFASMARGMGVEASTARTAEEFNTQLEAALGKRGPNLIEAVL